MKAFIFHLVFFLVFSINAMASDELGVVIHDPKNGTGVEHRQEIKGTVSDPNADVRVVIHPVETPDFWVQDPVTVKDDGSWKVIAYFGEAKPEHAGKPFEVRAFANPSENLSAGKTARWPKAAARSNVVDVIRK
jgi:hypothetical protein